MRQDQGGVAGKGAEHVDRLAVGQVVEVRRTSWFDAAAQRFAIKRDRVQRFWGATRTQAMGMATERGFEIIAAKRQEQVAQRVHRRSAPEAGAEDGVQALALQSDKGDDLLVGRRARKRGKDREQQQVAHAVAPALGAGRVPRRERQADKRMAQGDLTKREGRLHTAVTSPRPVHAKPAAAELNGPDQRRP